MASFKFCAGAIVVVSLVAMDPPAFSVDKQGETGNEQPHLQIVKGQVLKHENEVLTITDEEGKKIHLHLGKDTVIPGLPGAKFKPGDRIEANVTPDGHAKSVHPAP
jgi:hypothetical protein